MAVTAYNGRFSFQQNEIAMFGTGRQAKPMDEASREKLAESSFMQRQHEQEKATAKMSSARDCKRSETDAEFNPQDTDFSARKAFDYDVHVNYYKVLGVDEYATREDIKQAYRKLSLLYHPDKMAGLHEEEKDEYTSTFIEIKNAYLTLNDQATRRQYDRDRDQQRAMEQVNNFKRRPDKPSFDAKAMAKVLEELDLPDGETVTREVTCRLEKFFYGGHKRLVIKRQEFDTPEVRQATIVERVFWIYIPKTAPEGFEMLLPGQGDRHRETKPDSLNLVLRSRQHEAVERMGLADLRLRREVRFPPGSLKRSHISTDCGSVRGRHLLLWGPNPFRHSDCRGGGEMDISMRGEGLSEDGVLTLRAVAGTSSSSSSSSSPVGRCRTVARVTAAVTRIEFFVNVDDPVQVEDLRVAVAELLLKQDASEDTLKFSELRLAGRVPQATLDAPKQLYELPMPLERASEFLQVVLTAIDTDRFHDGLRACASNANGNAEEHERLLKEHWHSVTGLAPSIGYKPDFQGLRRGLQHALYVISTDAASEALRRRWAQFGFFAKAPPRAKQLRRRPKPRPAYLDFLLRNKLGAPRWEADGAPDPGSETDPDQSGGEEDAAAAKGENEGGVLQHGTLGALRAAYAASAEEILEGACAYPQVRARARRRSEACLRCSVPLVPLHARPIELYTRPPMALTFYGNSGGSSSSTSSGRRKGRLTSAADVSDGDGGGIHDQGDAAPVLEAPFFAVSLACRAGSKREGRLQWERARAGVLPVLSRTIFLLLRESRGVLPRPLPATPSFPSTDYKLKVGASVRSRGSEREMAATAEGAQAQLQQRDDVMFYYDELDEETVAEKRGLRDCQRWQRAFDRVWRNEQVSSSEPGSGHESAAAAAEEAKLLLLQAEDHRHLARAAYANGDHFTAQLHFSNEIASRQQEGDSLDAQALATALSNRCQCLCMLGHLDAALEDARKAAELAPAWARPWSRVAAIASQLAAASQSEDQQRAAYDAWYKAVELDPTEESLEGLREASAKSWGSAASALAEELKARGDDFMRDKQWASAVASHMAALGKASATDRGGDAASHRTALLQDACLCGNASACLLQLRKFSLALRFAEEAVEACPKVANIQARLGTACLASGLHERAYSAYAAALKADSSSRVARLGREAALAALPLWSSAASRRRAARFARDMHRPRSLTRVFSTSDVLWDREREEWAHAISPVKFQEDVLLIAGNLSSHFETLQKALVALRPKFRRIFYVPGNRELWIYLSEQHMFSDSIAKLLAIFELCDSLDIDVFPACIAEDVFIVPLLSWYNAAFDVNDPFPDAASADTDKKGIWPIDAAEQVWRYMLSLNEKNLAKPYHGLVVTCSHYAPNASCKVFKGLKKVSGCLELDAQVRQCRSSLHVYGHTLAAQSCAEDGVLYVNQPLGTRTNEHALHPPLLCVFNGFHVCSEKHTIM